MKILIIQTAFIGDVILATALIEKLRIHYPNASIDFLVRKGNESLLAGHPHLNKCLVFDKGNSKYRNLIQLIRAVRKQKYDYVVNAQRFFTTGLITALSAGKHKIGYNKNPLSLLFQTVVKHQIGEVGSSYKHETERNHQLIANITDLTSEKPRLYPSESDFSSVATYKAGMYICIAPTSVWFTKQFPSKRWVEFLDQLNGSMQVYLLGAPNDKQACEEIIIKTKHQQVENLAGELSLLASAALMKDSEMNYVNDSAPMHLASAMNASVCAVYCSTVPSFGFGPLSDNSHIIEVKENLECRPCGLHGHKSCPRSHFNCASQISVKQMLALLS